MSRSQVEKVDMYQPYAYSPRDTILSISPLSSTLMEDEYTKSGLHYRTENETNGQDRDLYLLVFGIERVITQPFNGTRSDVYFSSFHYSHLYYLSGLCRIHAEDSDPTYGKFDGYIDIAEAQGTIDIEHL